MEKAPHESVRFNLCTRSNEKNTAPVLDFIENVDEFVKKYGYEEQVNSILEELNRLHRGLKIHQQRLITEKAELEVRLPDMKENIRLVQELKVSETTRLRFMAADSVWADAIIEKPKDENTPVIGLWLGANVLMEYTYDEAEALLSKSISDIETTIKSKTEDLKFLKTQVTTTEVTISRFYNYEVHRKRKLRTTEQNPN